MATSTTLVVTLVAALLLVHGPHAAVAGGPLELIAPGLTEAGLCPLANSNPQAVINAIAQGATAAYNKGGDAPSAYAAALGVGVGAAAANGCIDTVFELVNQAIIKGGYPVEVVVGRALAKGTAQGVDSATGEVLAKATAVVICRGGESASACARAWSQAVKMDGNGCLVLVKAYAYAKARCGPGYATSQVQSTVFKEPLGVCKADMSGQGSSGGGQASGQQAPAPISVSQGPDGQTVTMGNTQIQQSGQGMSTVSLGWPSGHWTMSKMYGRKMLLVDANTVNTVAINRKLLGWWSPSSYGGGGGMVKSTANSAAINNGVANGPITANSMSGAFGGEGQSAHSTANSFAQNNGVANGPVTANSVSVASGGK